MGWVKTDFDFGLPLARLVIPLKHGDAHDALTSFADDLATKPEAVEAALAGLVAVLRPDLGGGSVVAIRFAFEYARWEFLYTHRSLPRVPPGEMTRVIDLTAGRDDPPPAFVLPKQA